MAEATPEEQIQQLTAQVGELTGKLRQANHFATFKDLALQNGVKPKAVKALYGLVGYDPGDADEADPDAVLDVITGAKAEHDYCFDLEPPAETEKETKPKAGESATGKKPSPATALTTPKPVALGTGRKQAPPAKDTFRVTQADTRNPAWLLQNKAAYAEASKKGTLEIID